MKHCVTQEVHDVRCRWPLWRLVCIAALVLVGLARPAGAAPSVAHYDRSGSRRRHVPIIRDYLQLHAYDRAAQRLVIDALQRAAATKEHLADLINVAITELVKAHCELPGFTTLVKLAQRIRSAVYRRYYALVQARITPEVCARIDGWFQTEATATSSL